LFSMIRKTFDIQTIETKADGGRIVISTASVDRDRDRVIPAGARVENYMRNPVVQWGHGYAEPWQTIGKTTALEITPDGVVASFELRPAANESDPQNIVRLLWEGGWIRTASIGFIPRTASPNDVGGSDFGEWELLEWSLVPIPANQDALRLAMKAIDALPVDEQPAPTDEAITKEFTDFIETKRGRVLSRANESKLRDAYAAIGDVLAQLREDAPADEPASEPDEQPADEPQQESTTPGAKADEPPAPTIDEEFEQEIAARLSIAIKALQEHWK